VAELPLVILLALRCDLCPQADWLSRQLRAIEWIVMPRWLFLGANRLQNCGPVEVIVILGIAEALLLAPLLWRTKSWS
jgi:hypothetical protein